MNPASKDIKAILVAEAGIDADSIYLYEEPDSPDALICAFDQSGAAPEDMVDLYRPNVQIRVRGSKRAYEETYAQVSGIYITLRRLARYDINGTHYAGFWPTSDILNLGFDSQDRPQFSINFMVSRSPI